MLIRSARRILCGLFFVGLMGHLTAKNAGSEDGVGIEDGIVRR